MENYNYAVDESKIWPPKGELKPPYGPGIIEVMRSCPLRGRFDCTHGYERRIGYPARVGTALHKVLQSLNENPIWPNGEAQVAEEARERFKREMQKQNEDASEHPRERFLPHDSKRTARAEEAAMAEALRIFRLGGVHHTTHRDYLTVTATEISYPYIETEIPVSSTDGIFVGRIDRAEHTEAGVKLFDYKSALRDDVPERYERQLQLYAYLWHEARNEWPVEAQLYYPLLGAFHTVNIQSGVCEKTVKESRRIIKEFEDEISNSFSARPGDVCKVCEYRPWCKPFWEYLSAEKAQTRAMENAATGFSGEVKSITLDQHFWRMPIAWRGTEVQIVAPQERFPHLAGCSAGNQIRVLDTPLRGMMYRPVAMVCEYSEIFLLR